jgi:Arc/MetJ-type ribon-helix-helix transcriptional regulator
MGSKRTAAGPREPWPTGLFSRFTSLWAVCWLISSWLLPDELAGALPPSWHRRLADHAHETGVELLAANGYIVSIERVSMTTLTVQCPDQLAERLGEFVKEGWAADVGETMVEALRRFLDSHRPDVARTQALADVEWGLHGKD